MAIVMTRAYHLYIVFTNDLRLDFTLDHASSPLWVLSLLGNWQGLHTSNRYIAIESPVLRNSNLLHSHREIENQ